PKFELFDVYWIKEPNDVWHMKTLNIKTLEGRFINHLVRNEEFQFEKAESFISKNLSEIPLDSNYVIHRFIPYESRPIFTLITQAIGRGADSRIIFSHLFYKILAPLIPFIILIGVAPLGMR